MLNTTQHQVIAQHVIGTSITGADHAIVNVQLSGVQLPLVTS
jgi:hypothetical protein